MAEVFLGNTVGAEGFSRPVAIKRVLPGYSDNPQFAKMFIAEARISSRLVHPNIVSVLDFDRDHENRLFLVMELVDGKDLDALLQTGPLPASAVIHIIGEMLRGLGYAHDLPGTTDAMRGVVHRDVSPHNVLLSWEGAAKVSDFGIAKAREASSATASVFIKGKPAYMSPEQANGEALDGRSDLFAVGIMLWEMLVGRRLFIGGDTRATLAQVLFAQIPKPRGQRPDVPKDLERVCMKLLERAANDRYRHAEDAIADLMKCSSAPKAGRDELVALLAQRFPSEAPVRFSQRNRAVKDSRSNGDSSAPVVAMSSGPRATSSVPVAARAPSVASALGAHANSQAPMLAPGAPTIRGRAINNAPNHTPNNTSNVASTPVNQGALAHAITHTAVAAAPTASTLDDADLGASQPRRWLIPVLAITALLIGVVIFAVTRSAQNGQTADSVPAKQVPAAAVVATGSTPAVITIDAAPSSAIDATPPTIVAQVADAASHTNPATPPVPALVTAPPPGTATVTSAHPTATIKPKVKTGRILVVTDPPGAKVSINGKVRGVTPNTFDAPIGRADILFSKGESVIKAFVIVQEGKTSEVEREFTAP